MVFSAPDGYNANAIDAACERMMTYGQIVEARRRRASRCKNGMVTVSPLILTGSRIASITSPEAASAAVYAVSGR
jgi:hypothetical protein